SVKQNKGDQLNLFEENLEEFKLVNTFTNRVKSLGLLMGVQITDEIIQSWEKYGEENVLLLMEKIQDRKDINNPIGYITKVLRSSSEENGEESLSQDQIILPYLITYFKKSNETMPDWFIEEKAVEELQLHYSMNPEEAKLKFEEIKKELFKVLGVPDISLVKTSDEEYMQKQKGIEEMLKQLRESNEKIPTKI
ncbi:MAG: replication initiation protein, partial [Bacillus sp. (in: firmicutes)]